MLQQISTFEKYLHPFPNLVNPYTFCELMEEIINYFEELTRTYIKELLEEADNKFRYSKGHINRYYVKDYTDRTITTMAGTITYKRTIYTDICIISIILVFGERSEEHTFLIYY